MTPGPPRNPSILPHEPSGSPPVDAGGDASSAGTGGGSGTGGERPAGGGWSAVLENVSLWDLLQFEALLRGRRALRITSAAEVGFIYFRGGNLVHAEVGGLRGEPAIRQMLEWSEGKVEPYRGPWPAAESIVGPLQSLLLAAAQAEDHAQAGLVLPFPTPEPVAPAAKMALGPDGSVLDGGGKDPPLLPEVATYAARMADLIGDFLGLGPCKAIEAEAGGEIFGVVRTAGDGWLVGRSSDPGFVVTLREEAAR